MCVCSIPAILYSTYRIDFCKRARLIKKEGAAAGARESISSLLRARERVREALRAEAIKEK